MKLKICGMKSHKNILEASQLLPDFMGFIFWEQSPRFFDGIITEIPSSILKVGVFVNENIDIIIETVKKNQLDYVQLHGNESPQFCQQLNSKNIKIIKAFSIGNNFDFALLKPYEPHCDYFLFDTKGKMPGGNGIIFNWTILENYTSGKPFFLSGGIGIDAIPDLQEINFPVFAIDVNSKFETKPGIKNIPLLKQFQSQLHELSR